ncbi:MAG: TIM44-like domain-containing protein [Bacteroidales bacterium]|nr:TIM44-like domain-containing protein [Bacteroidales bacterium]
MNRISRHAALIRSIAVVMILLLVVAEAYARAGGGGGGGGGGGDGLGGLIFYILMMLPFPWNIIVIGIIIALFYLGRKKRKQASVLNKMPNQGVVKTDPSYQKFLAQNPSFNEEGFKKKVEIAFHGIQKSWMEQDMKSVRKFISDGVYQRFHTQFEMMKLLGQRNELKDIKLHSMTLTKVRVDGLYDVIDVAIHASMTDHFKSEKFSSLNSGEYESFVEYWSFLKKRGESKGDLFGSQHCPNCGAELSDIQGEVSMCSYCKAITNSGEYDWVLSEITQADDYTFSTSMAHKQANLDQKIAAMLSKDKNISIQLLEDKASNAFLQMETARVKQDASLARRFLTNDAYEYFEQNIKGDKFIYNRIFLNDVSTISAWTENGMNNVAFYIRQSSQKVRIITNDKGKEHVDLLDPTVRVNAKVLVLCRAVDAVKPKGSLYTHQCPSCGGTLSDTLDLKCPYCSSMVNSPKTEWVVEGVYSVGKYKQKMTGEQIQDQVGIGVDKFDNLLDVRDYAFNNAMLMMAADGVFTDEEKDLANKLAKKFGYKPDKVQPVIDMALNNKLVLRMPEDAKKHGKIIKLMEKAAMIDNEMHPKEKELLDFVKSNFNQN